MKSSALFIAICLLVSCDKTEKMNPPAGLKLSDLPTSIHSRQIENKESRYLEIVISENTSELFHQGKKIATATTTEELLSVFKRIRTENVIQGYTTPLLISAPASTRFHVVAERIRNAAETGIEQILFLVLSNQDTEPQVVSIDLYMGGARLPNIEPYFLEITADGHIYSGSGPSRTQMDSNIHDQQLDILSEQLKLYCSAAKSAGDRNLYRQVYVDPQSTYQRFIDLISLTNKYDIYPHIINLWEEPETESLPIPKRKPSPPGRKVKPSGLSPRE